VVRCPLFQIGWLHQFAGPLPLAGPVVMADQGLGAKRLLPGRSRRVEVGAASRRKKEGQAGVFVGDADLVPDADVPVTTRLVSHVSFAERIQRGRGMV